MKMHNYSQKTFIKGINASVDRYNQPPGSVPRASNLLLSKRGSLIACDGTQILHAFNGVPTAGRGPILAIYYYPPTGVPGYYVLLARVNIPIGPPQNLTLATAAGGNLAAATYYYKVTALDGMGGETTASNEANVVTGASGKNTLTWNVVPNATGYNIYRGTAPGTETLLSGPNLPVLQPTLGTLTASFVDDGTSTLSSTIVAVTDGMISFISHVGALRTYFADFNVASSSNIVPSKIIIYTPGSNVLFAANWKVSSVFSQTSISATLGPIAAVPGLEVGSTTTGGQFTVNVTPPIFDTTQQIALYKMAVLPTPTVVTPYNDSNIVALFPANPIASSPAGQFSGGGGTGGGAGGPGGGGEGGGTGGRGGGGSPIALLPD